MKLDIGCMLRRLYIRRYRHIKTSYHAEHAFSYIGLGSYRRLGYRQRTLHIVGT